ncbi:MAG: squalene/phytoene synthase family protein [Hyphomonadaceae bacterium]|nr:squalene/phytoene synthase family protein [Hyphomonadaceae bacterium]MBC6411633.1 squalene/phytoene synthase family protein [Hyphomonadaceae bacterium]
MLDDHLRENLLKVDPDRYRAAMFAQSGTRERLLVFYAFHAELSKVPERVSGPVIGQIRYQWWRDAIDEIYSGEGVRNHEVAASLTQVLHERDVPRYWIDRLIDGRERDLDPTPFKNIDDARNYCRRTSGVLMQIAAWLCVDEFNEKGVLKAGESWGLTGLARSWKYYRRTILSELTYETVGAAAHETYTQARTDLGKLPEMLVPALAYAGLVPKYLSRLRASKFNPDEDSLIYPVLLKQLRLMGVVMRGFI